MQPTSLMFYVFAAAVLLIYNLNTNLFLRKIIVAAASIFFLFSFVDKTSDGLIYISFLILCYFLLVLTPVRRGKFAFYGVVFLVIIFFIAQRNYFKMNLFHISMIGLSYVLFRFLQLLIDRHQGSLEKLPSLVEFFAYVIYFPALISGPVHSFDQFNSSLEQNAVVQSDLDSYKRLLKGIFKVTALAPLIQQFFNVSSYYVFLDPAKAAPTVWAKSLFGSSLPIEKAVPISLAIYPFYLYFNFSGYTDIVIAVSSFFRISLPENFNRPFKAKNISEFWSRWHISLSDWFKNYLFNPMVASLTARFPNRSSSAAISVFTIFSVFFIIGLWHGSTLEYFYYAVYLGATAALHRIYQIVMIKWLGQKEFRNLGKKKIYSHFCRALTFGYFALALSCLWMNASQIQKVIQTVTPESTMVNSLGILFIVSVLFWALEQIENSIQNKLSFRFLDPRFEPFWLGAYTFIILFLMVANNHSPGFVYRGY